MTIQPLSLEQTHALMAIIDGHDDDEIPELLAQFIIDYGYCESTTEHFSYDHRIVSYTHRSLGGRK